MSDELFGIAFPFRIGGRRFVAGGTNTQAVRQGGVASSSGFDKIAEDVRHFLSTRVGERVMQRGFGGGVHHRLQSSSDSTLRALIRSEVEKGLRQYLPRVRLTAPVNVRGSEGELTVVIEYTVDNRDQARRMELRIV